MKELFKIIYSIWGVVCAFLFGADNTVILYLAFVMSIDIICGWIVAIKNKELNSKKSFLGLSKKFMVLGIIIIAHFVDVIFLEGVNALRNMVIFYYFANEALSILENCGKLGLVLPKALKNILLQIKEQNDDEDF